MSNSNRIQQNEFSLHEKVEITDPLNDDVIMIYNAIVIKKHLKADMYMVQYDSKDIRTDYKDTELKDTLLLDVWDKSTSQHVDDPLGLLYAPTSCIQHKYNNIKVGPKKKKRCLSTNGPYHQ